MSTIDASKMDKYVGGKLISEGKKDVAEGEAINFHWWRKDREASMASEVVNTIKFMSTHQGSRMEQLTVSTRLYGNTSAFSLLGTAFTRASSVNSNPQSQRISFNLCGSVIDTLVAKVAKNRITPVFITNGGNWDIQQKAQDLSKFVEGMFYQIKADTLRPMQFRDGGVWGTGILKVFEKNDNPCVERTLPHELYLDMVESLVTYPRQLHQVRTVDRDVLLAEYPEEEDQEKIMQALPANYQELGGMGTAADLVTITESWHLPSDPNADAEDTDGVHAICVGDQTLLREPYTKDYYPFVFLHYNKRLLGFWGQGACERLQNLQGEINRLMILIQRSMWMGGSFKVFIENGSKVVSQHLNNDVGAIIRYTGTMPQYVTPPMIQQDIYPYVDSLIAKGFQQEGVSQLSASSMKPMGLDSGKAIRTYNNIEADRQMYLEQQVEECGLELARQLIEVAKDIYKRKKTMKVMFPSSTFTETIDWKDIQLEKDQYVMKAFPMSSLADDLSGKIQDVQELAQAGMISPRAARKLLRAPDIELADSLANAAEDLLHKLYERMLDDGDEDDFKFTPPEPYFDLTLAKQLGLEYYNYGTYHGCPENRLKLVIQFMKQVDDLLGLTTPQPVPSPLPTGPQAVPQAPPVSDLLPNAPMQAAA